MSVIAEMGTVSRSCVGTSVRPVRDRPFVKRTVTLKCLVVSEDESRLAVLAGAASDAGYEPIACSDMQQAWLSARRDATHLAFVDLAGMQNAAKAQDLGEHLVKDRKMLVAVCGAEDEPLQEIWARQIGAWLYLPGLAARQDLCSLCLEARPVLERMLGR